MCMHRTTYHNLRSDSKVDFAFLTCESRVQDDTSCDASASQKSSLDASLRIRSLMRDWSAPNIMCGSPSDTSGVVGAHSMTNFGPLTSFFLINQQPYQQCTIYSIFSLSSFSRQGCKVQAVSVCAKMRKSSMHSLRDATENSRFSSRSSSGKLKN